MYQFKSPAAALIVEADFEDFAAGDEITIAWTVPPGITNGGEFIDDGVLARLRLTGGADGAAYEVSVTATKGTDSQTQTFGVFVSTGISVDMVSAEVFLPFINVSCPGLGSDVAIPHAVEACKEFCEKTGLWQYELPALPIAAGVTRFEIPAPADSHVVAVMNLEMAGGHKPGITTPGALQARSAGTAALPVVWAHDESHLMLWPAPAEASTVRCTVILAPSLDALAVPAFLGTKYRRAIAEGAKYELMKIAGAPWENLTLAGNSKEAFDAAIDKGKVTAIHGRAPTQLRAKFRRLGG